MVVSAMEGTTDALLAVAQQAGSGDSRTVAFLIARLRSRHAEVARAVIPAGRGRAEVLSRVAEAFDELEALAQGLDFLRELTARTTDYLVGAGSGQARLVAAALDAAHGTVRGCRRAHPYRWRVRRRRTGLPAPIAGAPRSLPLLRGVVPVVAGFIGAAPDGEIATLGRGGTELTGDAARARLGAGRLLWKDVPGCSPPTRGSSPTRAYPAAARPRGGRAGLLRRQGAAPARADPGLGRPAIPVFVRPFADPTAAGHRDLRAPHARPLPGQGALGGRRPGAAHRRRATACWACRASRRAPSRRCIQQGISVSLISQSSSEQSICFSRPRGRRASARAIA